MTSNELKATLNKETIWMAAEAVRQGCEAARKTKQESLKQEALQAAGENFDFSTKHIYYEGVCIAAEILWRLFAGYSAAVQSAICKVAEGTSACTDSEDYFDLFVDIYERECGSVRLRIFQ